VPQFVLAVNRPAVALSTMVVAADAGAAGPRATRQSTRAAAERRARDFTDILLGG
jgi:hypothetical protein